MDVKMQKHVSLLNVVRTTTSTSYTNTSDREPIWFYDADAFDNVIAIYLEADLRPGNAADTMYAILSDLTPSDVSGSGVSATGSTAQARVRSGDIKGNLVDGTNYRARWKCDNGAGGAPADTGAVDAIRIIIVQQGAVTKTETVIEIAEDNNVPSTSYTAPADYAIFLFTASRFNGTLNVFLEADLKPTSAAQVTYAQLYDITAGAAVSGSEVSHTGDTTLTRKRSAAITLVDGHQYRADIKATATTDDIGGVKIIIQQTGTPTSTECYIPILNSMSSGSGSAYAYQNRLLDYSASEWDGDSETDEYEATLKVSVGAETGTYNLYNDTDATELAAATTTATAYTRDRDTSVTLPSDDTNTLNSGRKTSVGVETVTVARSFLIKTMTWSASAAAVTPLRMLMGMGT